MTGVEFAGRGRLPVKGAVKRFEADSVNRASLFFFRDPKQRFASCLERQATYSIKRTEFQKKMCWLKKINVFITREDHMPVLNE